MDQATHAPTSVRSLGELLALSMATPVPLRAVWRDDGTAREIWLLAGEVVHARHGALHGAPAVWATIDTDAGAARCRVTAGRLVARRLLGLPVGLERLEVECADGTRGTVREGADPGAAGG